MPLASVGCGRGGGDVPATTTTSTTSSGGERSACSPTTGAERNFNVVKQWRRLATRYDKLAIVYRAAAVLRAVTLWLAHLSDTPS